MAAGSRNPLAKYDAMRDFDATPEPPGRVAGSVDGRRRFLVQRHRARRLHYDFRIEVDGVLVSWAVPKGPSLDPAAKRMAMKTEDHPYAYGWFEGIIPSGYGQGDVIVWDDGWWDLDPEYPDQGDPAEAIAGGELKLVLVGRKLRGRFVILRTKGRKDSSGDPWLLIHKKDDDAVSGWDAEDHPVSVLSGRTNDDVVESRPGRWTAASDEELADLAELPAKGGDWRIRGVKATITNLDKVMMPGRDGGPPITKRDIIAYYATVAPWMSMSLSGRPINLNRYPDGIDSKKGGFYHKAVPTHAPPWVRRWPRPDADPGEVVEYLMIDGAASLVWAANFAGFEIHPWTSTAASHDEPSYALIDIDPGDDTTWEETLTLARLYRVAMDQLGLVARPKVTGKRGIQVWVPVRPGYSFRETADWVEAVSKTVGGVVPDLVSWKWRKGDRRGKARLDYTQNAVNKTLVAPYSIRPAPGAPVSVPLEWDELDDPDLRPDRWTIHTVLDRLRSIGDPFDALVGVRQDLPDL
ncbi:DNA polymerase ligase N-terminal domain-containing protein [Desertimonas flava]|jgi:bifunctional non-homologous end joining protein LigD|uniref:non-homologous end-joining DNA ligase LigD n=1 Tax=Desertimonas flava TaxID=2064846 RepID=UPI000E3470BC|nr:DNA polymerase ligase N-terminal domain-containing protein [Desertimonas flava]